MAMALAVIALVALGLCHWIVSVYWLDPMAKLPNAHPLSPVTAFWINWKRWKGEELEAVEHAFKTKGPIVRLGPKDIAVSTIEDGVKAVYGSLPKPDWYSFWVNLGTRNTMSALGTDHIMYRRRFGSVYAKSSVQENLPLLQIVHTLFTRLIPQISESAKTGIPIDVFGLNIAYGVDFVNAFTFGLFSGTNFIQDMKARNQWLRLYVKSRPSKYMYWLQEVPGIRKRLAQIGIKTVPDWVWEARRSFDESMLSLVDRTEERFHASSAQSSKDDDNPAVYRQLRLNPINGIYSKESGPPPTLQMDHRDQIASECLDHLVAVRDVFGISYTYILYEISRHPEAQRDVYDELRALKKTAELPLSEDPTDLPSPPDLESLPLLNAVIKESLRLRGTLPTPNPRVTPPNKTTTIGRYNKIPSGVRVNIYAWWLHRNEDVFPDCENWRPERWLGRLGDVAEQEKWFWAFWSGSRRCLGESLAYEMIRYGLALIYTNFETSVAENKGFGEHGNWVLGEADERLVLRFRRIKVSDAFE